MFNFGKKCQKKRKTQEIWGKLEKILNIAEVILSIILRLLPSNVNTLKVIISIIIIILMVFRCIQKNKKLEG
jgi:hypothetical protein